MIGALLLLTTSLGAQPTQHPAAGTEAEQTQETPAPAPPQEGQEAARPGAPADATRPISTPAEQGHETGTPANEGPAPNAPHEAAPAQAATSHGAEAAEKGHGGPAAILMHHVVDIRYGNLYVGPVDVGPTKHLLFFLVAAVAVLVLVGLARRSYKLGVPSGVGAAVEALVVFVRDEIAEKNIGHDGRRFVPLLLSFFFFILVAALLGLMPFSATSTGNLSVTLGLALVSFLAQQYAGISKHGFVHHFMGMVPAGMPKALLPIMIPVEILGMFTKPFALMIRLFANMLAGHMVITTLLLLIPLMASISSFFGVSMIPVSLGLGLFIMFLELLVAFIQSFIFTLLTAIFIGMYANPAH